MADGFEYKVRYRTKKDDLLSPKARNERVIKQTREGADKLVQWAKDRGYAVTLQRRAVSEWEDV